MFKLILFFAASVGFADAHSSTKLAYKVSKLEWCNGPVRGGDPNTCPSNVSWQGLQLKALKLLSFDLSAQHEYVRLEAENGMVWEADLKACNDHPSRRMGCKHSLNSSDPNKLSLQVHTWMAGQSDERLDLEIEKQTQLNVMGSDAGFMIFKLEPVR